MSNEEEYAILIKHIADNIRGQRKKNGFTQAQMADFGFDIKNYQKLEYGKHQFSLHTVFRLAMAFNCRIEDLINEPKKIKKSLKK
ncbi:MAG: helix-turn-helix transcriptional regulator [Bdellovibrionaceae bacterium]|nr:helix-turn-helix transcriptional regulator [Pseudobdellovibrionaceae bacterium]